QRYENHPMPLAPHATTTDRPLVGVQRGSHTAPFRGAIQGSPPREQRERHEVARHFFGAPRELPPKHYTYSAVYARGF
ncbi:hypothetical protein, partial [Porphyromonas endodontalis]|uniref:hypothetical protein n=1 Tax=Porphyromonas endodontalis TaxID=28124 RepID=UPI00288A7EB0